MSIKEGVLPRPISDTDRLILREMARGQRDVDIAEVVCLTASAVRKRRRRIEAKLGVRGCGPCMAVAWRLGLLDLESVAEELLSAQRPAVWSDSLGASEPPGRRDRAQVAASSSRRGARTPFRRTIGGVTTRTSENSAARWLAAATGPDDSAAADAFARLAASTRAGVLRMLGRSGLGVDEAEDVLQTALAEIWRSRRSVAARSGGEWYALVRRSAAWQLSRRASRDPWTRPLLTDEEIPAADAPYVDAVLEASMEAGRIRAAADDLWLGRAEGAVDTEVAAARLVLVEGIDSAAAAQMLGVARSEVEAWVRHAPILRRALFRSLCWPSAKLAGYVLRPHRPLADAEMDGVLAGAAEPLEAWGAIEAKVAVLRLRHGLTEKEIVRALAGAADAAAVAAMVDRVLAALPFAELACAAKAELARIDRADQLAAADLWKRVALEYAADDVPEAQILDLAAPPARVAPFNLDGPKLNRWLARGAILAQLASHLEGSRP